MSDPRPHTAQTLDDLPDMDDVLSRSGLEFMQDMLSGQLSGPPIGATMGFTLTSVEPGRVIFEGTPEFNVTNPMRGVHGGWYGAILDSALGCAVMTMLPKGQIYTTLEYKVNITRAVPTGTPVRAVGQVSHAGRRTGVATGELRGIDNGKLYATASTTCLIMDADH
ncbi:MAG: PaaI family thioesterase [Roseovarius sp.]